MDEEAIQQLGSAKELQLPALFHTNMMHINDKHSHVVIVCKLQGFRHTNEVKMNVSTVSHELSHEHEPEACISIVRGV